MIVRINGTTLPIEAKEEGLEPIIIKAAVSDGDGLSGWTNEIDFEADSGADIVMIPLPVLSKLLGKNLKLDEESASMVTADGKASPVATTRISLRIKTANGEVVVLHQVACSAAQDGPILLGRSALQVFRLTLVQNSVQEIILNPKIASWLRLSE